MSETNRNPSGEHSTGYAWYVVVVLMFVYVFKFADRFILLVLQNDIQAEMGLTDGQLGLLHGLAFAAFYAVVGLPIARFADKASRTWIIAVGVSSWSLLTAACGSVQSFTQFMLARIGVGVGEATATPSSHSIISDYFPPEKRNAAIGLYSVGANLGMLVGMAGGAIIAKQFGWRAAFYIVGLPGLIMAVLVKLTVREPVRGSSDNLTSAVTPTPLGETLRYLFSLRSFRHLCIACTLAAFGGYGVMNWLPVFLYRAHDMPKEQSGPILGLAIGIVGGLSVLIGGLLSQVLNKRNRRWSMYVSVIGILGMLPFIVMFLLTDSKAMAITGIYGCFFVGLFYSAPTFAAVQGLARPDMRALASAIFLTLISFIGTGLGPTFVGYLSDFLKPTYGAESLTYAMLIGSVSLIWSAIHYMLAARTLPEDLDSALKAPVAMLTVKQPREGVPVGALLHRPDVTGYPDHDAYPEHPMRPPETGDKRPGDRV